MRKRYIELDIARAVCILAMIAVHCFETASSFDLSPTSSIRYILTTVLNCVFGAGTFMFCMGACTELSNESENPLHQVKRGISLILLGYLLNIIRSVPILFFEGFESFLIYVLSLDILQFAGLALILFGTLKLLKIGDIGIFVLAVLMSVAGTVLDTFDFPGWLADETLGFFVCTVDPVYFIGSPFPLLNWFIFVPCGSIFGKAIKGSDKRGKLYCKVSVPAAAVVISYIIIASIRQYGMLGSQVAYYDLSITDASIAICGAISVLGLYYLLSRYLPETVLKACTFLSKRVTYIYLIQWITISWTWAFFLLLGLDTPSDCVIFVWSIFISIVSILIAWPVGKRLSKKL